MKTIELQRTISASNDRDADALRLDLQRRGVLLINLMSAAGAGKTTLLKRTITDLKDRLSIGVVDADIASTVDAQAIADLGAPAVQAHTDGMCHMDAGMTRLAVEELLKDTVRCVFLENVGNLICPAEFDTGAHRKVMILSVPEGDDKPLKYPLMFRESDVLLITKIDALPYFDFRLEQCVDRARALNPAIQIFPVSAKTGQGMDAWEQWLLDQLEL